MSVLMIINRHSAPQFGPVKHSFGLRDKNLKEDRKCQVFLSTKFNVMTLGAERTYYLHHQFVLHLWYPFFVPILFRTLAEILTIEIRILKF